MSHFEEYKIGDLVIVNTLGALLRREAFNKNENFDFIGFLSQNDIGIIIDLFMTNNVSVSRELLIISKFGQGWIFPEYVKPLVKA